MKKSKKLVLSKETLATLKEGQNVRVIGALSTGGCSEGSCYCEPIW